MIPSGAPTFPMHLCHGGTGVPWTFRIAIGRLQHELAGHDFYANPTVEMAAKREALGAWITTLCYGVLHDGNLDAIATRRAAFRTAIPPRSRWLGRRAPR